MSKKHKDGLESCVLNANNLIKLDESGEYYLAICNYYVHIGPVIKEQTCIDRNCPYFDIYKLKNQKIRYKIHRKHSSRENNYNPFSEISENTGECDVVGMENLE